MARQIIPVGTGTSINGGSQIYLKTITVTAAAATAVLTLKNAAAGIEDVISAPANTTVVKHYADKHLGGHLVEGSTADLTGAGAFARLDY